MTHNEFETLSLLEVTSSDDKDEEYNNPLDISELLELCETYVKVGPSIRQQIKKMCENDANIISSDSLRALPFVKDFLKKIANNVYFGDAGLQAIDLLSKIKFIEDKYSHIKCDQN
jgi:hypothetical protein